MNNKWINKYDILESSVLGKLWFIYVHKNKNKNKMYCFMINYIILKSDLLPF